MPEPTSTTATVTLATSAAAVPVLTLFGIPLGIQADHLLAGFAGSVAAMALLDTVPGSSDTVRELFRTSVKRIGVAVGSALCAGYLVPLAGLLTTVPGALSLSLCFLVGAGAQRILRKAIDIATKKIEATQ